MKVTGNNENKNKLATLFTIKMHVNKENTSNLL